MDKYKTRIVALTLNGDYITLEQWQKQYGLSGNQIGKYFSFMENKFRENIEDYGKLIVCEPLMIFMDTYRELKGARVIVNSFNRSPEKQASLLGQGFKTAKVSPHVAKMAVDLDTEDEADTKAQVVLVRQAAAQRNLRIRVGWMDYMAKGGSFIHVDVAPMYYDKHGVWHNEEHPPAWELQNEW